MTKKSKKHFWHWFEQNHEELRDLPYKSDAEYLPWRKELTDHFKALHEDCNGTVGSENGDAMLIITVDGIRDLFQEVDDLVAEAPDIPGWKFHALLPPGCYDSVVEKLKIEAGIDPDEFRFSFRMPKPDKRAEIVVFHPLYTPEIDIMMFDLADRTIFNLLGERSYGNNIEEIDLTDLSNAEPDKLESLNVLPVIFNAGFVVGKDGSIAGLRRNKN